MEGLVEINCFQHNHTGMEFVYVWYNGNKEEMVVHLKFLEFYNEYDKKVEKLFSILSEWFKVKIVTGNLKLILKNDTAITELSNQTRESIFLNYQFRVHGEIPYKVLPMGFPLPLGVDGKGFNTQFDEFLKTWHEIEAMLYEKIKVMFNEV